MLSIVGQFSVTHVCTTAAPSENPTAFTCCPGQALRWSRISRFSSSTPCRVLMATGIAG
ncbi:hypothetical protein [Amycolatopsis methanolica]|uniref:hypothetical protein n=1 Tax=Amycolatopsis methanolica TaxID=1814 RepID=UPI00341880B6